MDNEPSAQGKDKRISLISLSLGLYCPFIRFVMEGVLKLISWTSIWDSGCPWFRSVIREVIYKSKRTSNWT